MHILADECVIAPVVERLRQAGHDVSYVTESLPGIFDPEVLKQAREEARLLLTADRDFGTLVFVEWQSIPTRVLYLRMGTAKPPAVVDVVLDAVENPNRELAGYFTTVQSGRVRQRPLPS